MISANIYAQLNLHFGPFSTNIPDPLAHNQERRMVKKEMLIATQAAAIAAAIGPLVNSVVGYDKNLSASGSVYSGFVTPFIKACKKSITTQRLTTGIPGLNQFNVVNKVRTAIKLKAVSGIESDHKGLMLPTNAMLDGERRLMSLKTIRLALKTTLNE